MNVFRTTPSQEHSGKFINQSIKNIFGFKPGNIHLYKLAFRHKSANEDVNGIKINNERLEYLGDAVLGSVIADYLFKKFPYKGEGFLTEMRSKIVRRSNLNLLSRKMGLDKMIESSPETFSNSKSMRGDAFEAFIGALYLDKGYEFTRKVIINRIVNIHIDIDELEHKYTNYKSMLIEWAQKEKREVEFRLIGEKGEKSGLQYEVEIVVDNEVISRGIDYSIKGAEKIAAEKACNKIIPE